MPENATADRPHAPMSAERLRAFVQACLWRHADIESVRAATPLAMDRLAILAVDADGLTWRLWLSRDPMAGGDRR